MIKKIFHYGGNLAEAVLAFALYGVLDLFYFDVKSVHQRFGMSLQMQTIVTAVVTVAVMWIIFWLYKKQLQENNYWGFNERPHWGGKKLGTAIVGFVLIVALQIVLFRLLGGNSSSTANQQELNALAKQNGNMFKIMVVFIAPFCEELIFRGMFFNTFFTKSTKSNKVLGILLSGLIFAYMHDPSFSKYILVYWAMGCVLGWVYLSTKDVRYSMLTHMLNNAMSLL